MTSLARQLQQLAVPYAQSVLGDDRRRPSLLFDSKEAANIDRHALLALGVSGLEELQSINNAFVDEESNLFNQASENWERSMQTKEVNQQLDVAISEFLIKLSPYFLLRSSHKTLEWLLFRYHIHQFNTDTILLSILPYHDTKVFVRMIQLLPLDNPAGKWHWLQPAAKSGVPISRSTIVKQFVKNASFQSFICDMIPKFIKVHGAQSSELRTVLAFCSSVVLGALSNSRDITDGMIAVLAPFIISGLKSKCTDYKAATYMIVSQLVSQTKMQQDFVISLLPVLTKNISLDLSKEGVLCIALIFQTHRLNKLPRKCMRHLCQIPALSPLLAFLSAKYDLGALLGKFLSQLVTHALLKEVDAAPSSTDSTGDTPQYNSLLQAILQDVPLDSTVAANTVRVVLEDLVSLRQRRPTWQPTAAAYLHLLETRYPSVLDAALSTMMSTVESDDAEALKDVISVMSSGITHHTLGEDGATSLFLGLSHPQFTVRMASLERLAKALENKQNMEEDFVKSVFEARLSDEHPQIIEKLMEMQEHLMVHLDKTTLGEKLLRILQTKAHKTEWGGVMRPVVEVLCSEAMMASSPALPVKLLPYLLVPSSSEDHMMVATAIMRAPLVTHHQLFIHVHKEWMSTKDRMDSSDSEADTKLSESLNGALISGLGKSLAAMDASTLTALLGHLSAECEGDTRLRVITLACLGNLLQGMRGKEKSLEVSNTILSLISALERLDNIQFRDPSLDLADQLPVWIDLLFKNEAIHQGVVIYALSAVISSIQRLSKLIPDGVWLNPSDPVVDIVIQVIRVLTKLSCEAHVSRSQANLWQRLQTQLTQKALSVDQFSRIVCALIMVCQEEANDKASRKVQLGSLYLLAKVWMSATDDAQRQLASSSPALGVLLSMLIHPRSSVRQAALTCVAVVRGGITKHNHPAYPLIKKILHRKQEILADHTHMAQVVYSVVGKRGAQISEGRSAEKQACLELILGCLSATSAPSLLQQALLDCLAEIPTQMLLKSIVPLGLSLLEKLTSSADPVAPSLLEVVHTILSRLDADVAPQITSTSEEWQLLTATMKYAHVSSSTTNLQISALTQINKTFFHALPSIQEQQSLVSAILNVAEKTKSSDVANTAHKTLKQIKLCCSHIKQELMEDKSKKPSSLKAHRRSRVEKPEVVATFSWRRVTTLLEILQHRKHMPDSEDLLLLLFPLLNRLMESDEEDIEYLRHLVLSCLHNFTKGLNHMNVTLKQDSLNLEVLVQCIRNSQSTQMQQLALLVMADIAKFFPDYILHNVMSVFTFVGSGLLQQDDSHSLQVITHTLHTLIPAFLQANEGTSDEVGQTNRKLEKLIASILQVFIDARHAVPRHRCLLVFKTLLSTLGAEQYLWMVMVLLVESAVRNKATSTATTAPEEPEMGADSLTADLEFGCSIIEQFPVSAQVQAVTRTLTFLQEFTAAHVQINNQGLPVSGRKASKTCEVSILDISTFSQQQIRLFHFHLTKMLPPILTNSSFVQQFSQKDDSDEATGRAMEVDDTEEKPDLHVLVQEAMCYITKVATVYGGNLHKPTTKFWRTLLSRAYDIIDKVNYLLATEVLLDVVSSLLLHDLLSVRKKALELLSTKLQQLQPHTLLKSEVTALLSIMETLQTLAKDNNKDTEVMACRQMALFSLKLLCRLLGASHPKTFSKLFVLVIGLLEREESVVPVLASSMLCLAELVSTLKAHAIPHLNTFMPPLITILANKHLLNKNEILLTCGITTLQRIVINLPHFLSPYIQDILLVICELDLLMDREDGNKKSTQSAARLDTIRHHMATEVTPRVLLPSITRCLTPLQQTNQMALRSLMALTQEHVEVMKLEELNAQHTQLLALFCQALDIRNTATRLSNEEASLVESSVIDAILAMVVRLSETSFRPIFYKLYDWACREDTEDYKNRKLVFFKLADKLAGKLKSLFNLFVRHTLQAACKLLEQNNTLHGEVTYFGSGAVAGEKSCHLVGYILSCLQKCMLYDTEKLFHLDVFNMLLKPLVDQIENEVGSDEAFERRITDEVAPCLSQLSVTSQDDPAWKTLNYQILLKTRHSSPKVRFASLQVVESMAQRLGEEYSTLLPETLPFLAELMEDETEEVEQKCQAVIHSLEQVLGESLQKYF